MNLNDVHRGIVKNRKRKRLGRGKGSGLGKTSGRGHKGQGQLAGWSAQPTFQGGTLPLVRRLPKRGFNNPFGAIVKTLNVSQLDAVFADGEEVTIETLHTHSLAKGRYDVLKILGDGEITKKLTVHAHRFSKSAEEKIKAAGGEVVVIPGKTPATEKIKSLSQDRGGPSE